MTPSGCHGGTGLRSRAPESRASKPRAPDAPARNGFPRTALLVGNPNVGKSVLFRNLTGRYVTVSNYPGTTVEVVRARAAWTDGAAEVVDTPGINDLVPTAEDARVTRRLLEENPEATVVQVADAKNLRRALLLTLQLAELRRPMVLVLNMQDELAERGGRIDQERLAEILGIPVVGTVAPADEGTDSLVAALPRARVPSLLPGVPSAGDARPGYEAGRVRMGVVNDILAETFSLSPPERPSLRTRLGFWTMHPVKGILFLAVALLGVFWFVGLLGAGTMVDLLEVGVFEQRLGPLAIRGADAVLPFPHTHEVERIVHDVGVPFSPVHDVTVGVLRREALRPGYTLEPGAELSVPERGARFVHDFLVGEYGTFTMALSYALAIVLPIVTAFFLLFSVLEDSGYFSRMAVMLNRSFRLMGLNGKAVLPMILGLGCVTMATMSARILETRRERLVTTMLLALAVPCSAQLGVLLAMMAALSPTAALAWLAVVVGVLLTVGWLTARVIGGETSDFILEIPPLRVPGLSNVLAKTRSRLGWYLREVIPIFVLGTAILFLLDEADLLAWLARAGEPLVSGWLGLPAETANAFLVGFLRRDFGAVYLLDAATGAAPLLTDHQIFVAMITITLFMPCIATLLMVAREHGARTAWKIVAFIFPFAFLVGGLFNRLGQWLPIF